MTAQTLPWFKTWPTNFIAETSHLSAEETGAYFTLLCRCWMNGCSLPTSLNLLSRWARCSEATCSSILEEFFEQDGSIFKHPGLEAMHAEASESKEKNTKRATHAAQRRWASNAPASLPDASSIPTASVENANKEVEEEVETEEEIEGEGKTEAEAKVEGEADLRIAVESALNHWRQAPVADKPQAKAEYLRLSNLLTTAEGLQVAA